ncbi:aminoacyl-tRNA hydrolase [Candidatus Uhrbacteria bacterium]|jgi:peptidyl-tRNA hydrolase, PTH1 family|nr:aminoacyl-tRNA hydrolase [Candidatus Uhrbacteria bacterium]
MPALIVGIGNPGKKYENTRHNAGFMVVDALAQQLGWNWSKKFLINALVTEGNIDGQKVILAKPQAFMNLSGQATGKLAKKYKVDPSDIVVVYDDVDIDLGKLRWRDTGSAGGHNGMKSIISVLGTQDFGRLRVGIGAAAEHVPLEDHVLGKLSKKEKEQLPIDEATAMLLEKAA